MTSTNIPQTTDVRDIEDRLIDVLSTEETIDLAAALEALLYVTASLMHMSSIDEVELAKDFAEALSALVESGRTLQ